MSKLLSCWSCFIGWGSSPCLTSWIDLTLLGGLWSTCCLCSDLHTISKWLVFLDSPYVFPYPGQCLCECTVPQYFQFFTHFCFLWASLSCIFVLHLTESKSLASWMLSSVSFCALCTPAFWPISVPFHLQHHQCPPMPTPSTESHLSCHHHLAQVCNVLLILYHILCNYIPLLLSTISPSIPGWINGFFSWCF